MPFVEFIYLYIDHSTVDSHHNNRNRNSHSNSSSSSISCKTMEAYFPSPSTIFPIDLARIIYVFFIYQITFKVIFMRNVSFNIKAIYDDAVFAKDTQVQKPGLSWNHQHHTATNRIHVKRNVNMKTMKTLSIDTTVNTTHQMIPR